MKLSGASRCLTWPTKANDSSPVDSYPYFWGREINHFYQGDRVNYPGPKHTWCDLFFSVYPGDSRVTQEKLAPVPNFLPDTQSEGVWIQNLSTFCQVRTINVSLLMKIYNGGLIPACDNDFSYLNRVIFFNALGEKMQRRILKSESPIIERSYQRKQMTKRSHAAFTWVFVNVILATIFFTEL